MIRVEKPAAPKPDHAAVLADLRKAKKAIARAQKALAELAESP